MTFQPVDDDPRRVIICGEAPPWGRESWDEEAESTKRLAAAITASFQKGSTNVYGVHEFRKHFVMTNVWPRSLPRNDFDTDSPSNHAQLAQLIQRWSGRYVIAVERVARCLERAYSFPDETIRFLELSDFPPLPTVRLGWIIHPSPSMKDRFDPYQKQIGSFLRKVRSAAFNDNDHD